MRKKWLLLLGMSIVLGGCSSGTTPEENDLKECTDSGETYYCHQNEVCCGGACVEESEENCGTCGNKCSEGSLCDTTSHSCVCESMKEEPKFCTMTCTPNDGCVNMLRDPKHCGKVGNACGQNEVCDNGTCSSTCSDHLDNCNGMCVDIHSDVNNCGGCGIKCPSGNGLNIVNSYCMEGECNITCSKGYIDADEDLTNGCEEEVQFQCGNGIVENGEQCDGFKLNDMTCAKLLGEGSRGILTCNADCSGFNTDQCSQPSTCGNGRIDGAEVCDGKNLGNATCASVVGEGSEGFLGCSPNCGSFDTSACSAPTTCGNGTLDEGEVCDGNLLNNATCETAVGLGSTGTLKCAANCSEFDRSACTSASVCGNGILEAGEECDGTNFNGLTCESQMGAGSRGSLVCNNCKISVENCGAPSTCGNNIIDQNEKCDGTSLNNMTCEKLLGEGSTGNVSCKPNCSDFDISSCTTPAKCGDGIISGNEVCDGAKLNDQTCATIVGFGSTGQLVCNKTCTGFVTTGCSKSTTCGNGVLETKEACDTTNVNGATCDSEVGPGSTGVVLCGTDCTVLNLSNCSAATQCGNGKLDDGEVCDGTDFKGATCESVVGKGSTGTLKCGDGCKHFDISGCSKSQFCGDGAISDNEVCDGTNLAGRTCESVVGFGSVGVLKCADNCMGFDTSKCTAAITCGNGKLDDGEVCDINQLNGASCSSLVGFGSTGALKCNDTCSGFDTSACSEVKTCGNGKLDEGEVCDGYNLNGRTCGDIVGFGSTGTPECNSTCTGFLTGSCTAEVKCGNGKLDEGEECDSTMLDGKTCEDIVGIGSTGKLSCDSSCHFNTTNCSASRGCGNGTLEDGEVCDGTKFLGNKTACATLYPDLYESGKVTCADNCTYDTSDCVSYCGNGSVNGTKGEKCDHSTTADKFPTSQNTCEKVVGQGSTGSLVCADDCKSIITNQCTESAYCGDGKLNGELYGGEEYCDGDAWLMGTSDCSAWGDYKPGNKVKCLGNCMFDTSDCVPNMYCGDGEVNGTEECDRDAILLDMKACADWNPKAYNTGNVKCNNTTCKIDYSDCKYVEPKTCGNGKLDGNELCDGDIFDEDIKSKSCTDWDSKFTGGTLKCTDTCEIDDSACTTKPAEFCGDGIVNGDEVCDGTKFLGGRYACKTLFPDLYASGSVKCNSDCTYDTSACQAYCGNGSVNTTKGEKCDHSATNGDKFLSGTSCNSEMKKAGYTGAFEGTLKCSDDCRAILTTDCKQVEKCGDGIVNGDEFCDGTKFLNDQKSCSYWNGNFESGTVGCSSTCEITYDNCKLPAVPTCGDGIVNQDDEWCDGTKLNTDVLTSWNCADFDAKYASGTLSCNSNCEPDESKCVLRTDAACGNGKLDEDLDEACDVVNGTVKFYGDETTCSGYDTNYASGDLKCTKDCKLDLSACKVPFCGDGVLSVSEACDGNKFHSDWDTCAKLSSNYSGGTLKCTSDCNIDDSGCTKKCGNGTLEADEECDGNKFQPGMDTCSDWIKDTVGTLACKGTCEVDYSQCKAKPIARCGDGILNTAAEECDGNDFLLGVTDCADYANKYESGKLSCNSDCTVNESACKLKYVAKCGDGIFDDNYEECDAGKFLYDIKTCAEYSPNYNAGMLKCNSNCEIDTSACSFAAANTCGNGKLEVYEVCDGQFFINDDNNCTAWGDFASGKVSCTPNCNVDLSACVKNKEATCGDGKVNTAFEDCDGSEFFADVTDCADYSNAYVSGTLKCDSNCKYDTSACKKPVVVKCGDGKLDDGEECDGDKFLLDIDTCAEYSNAYKASTSKLTCTKDCKVDVTECLKDLCPENEIRCAGEGNNELQMCVDGAWEMVENCNAKSATCKLSEDGETGKCEAKPLDFTYCAFNYYGSSEDEKDKNRGYGRLLLPKDDKGNVIDVIGGSMYCTTDLSTPVLSWKEINASQNTLCGDCGANLEYKSDDYSGTAAGTYYCTFVFAFLPEDKDDDLFYACPPTETNAGVTSTPIKLSNSTTLDASMTRSFVKTGCAESEIRCNGTNIEMCIDGVWSNIEDCSKKSMICEPGNENCIKAGASYDNLVTMNNWVTANATSYTTTKDQTMPDGSKITVKAAFYVKDRIIDGVTAVFKPASNTSIKITGLTNGVGTFSFKYRAWPSNKAKVTVKAGDFTQTIDVTDSATTKTASFTINSKVTELEVTGAKVAGDGRYLIDDIRWTSMP